MSRFYGDLKGGRGEATRQGTPKSGIEGHLRGWNTGARVVVLVSATGKDLVRVYRTGGSSNSSGKLIAEWYEDSPAPAFYK